MSFFKKRMGKASGKNKEKENVEVKTKSGDVNKDDDFELPPSIRRPDRNLSISRSGRHKMRQRQRATIMKEGWCSPEGDAGGRSSPPDAQAASGGQPQLSETSGGGGGGGGGAYHCRETVDPTTSNMSGSQRMSRAPTAV